MWAFLGFFAGCVDTDSEGVVVLEPYLPDAERIASVPIYGGTLESAPGWGGLVAADPEGDRLLRVVMGGIAEVDLGDNARPFRVHVEDEQAWVTLRGTGELVSVALQGLTIQWRTRICLEPRGVTRSPSGPLVVACAGGELVEVDDDGSILRLVIVDSDLRDVVAGRLTGGEPILRVSRFATAEILAVDPATLELVYRTSLGGTATAAWRMRSDGDDALVLHQRATTQPITVASSTDEYYGTGDPTVPCGTIVEPELSFVTGRSVQGVAPLGSVTVATDFVVAADGLVAVASAGAGDWEPGVVSFALDPNRYAWRDGTCHFPQDERVLQTAGRAAALGFDVDGTLVVQSAAPLSLARAEQGGVLHEEPPNATTDVKRLFHASPRSLSPSCASCHPEGHDDGHVWSFSGDEIDEHRTMPLAGAILSRSPYHWDAALHGPAALMDETFVRGMGGREIDPEEATALFDWLDGLRHVRSHPAADESEIEIGRGVFVQAGCDDCHAGEAFTTNVVASVGRGTDAVKTPTLLGVGIRNHLLHDGCASDLDERFEHPCVSRYADVDHGSVSTLTDDGLEALKVYLRTL